MNSEQRAGAGYHDRVVTGWPLIGRREELAHIIDVLHAPGGPSGIVLAGAAGVGKTRLAREALAALSADGVAHHWMVATASAGSLPLGAFRHLVSGSHDAREPALLARRLSEALKMAAGTGVVIGIDDAHLLDELSASLVLRLALDGRVRLLVTVRSSESAPDAVTALWKDGYLTRRDVSPLSEEATTELLEATLEGHVESHSARRLYTVSRGNAMVLQQLVLGATAAGGLVRSSGIWQWRGGPTVTPMLSDLIDTRVGRLKPEVYAVLELLAFCEPLELAILGRLTDAWAVELAEQLELITVERSGQRTQARCAHPIYAEALRARTGTLRARRLRGELAEALRIAGARRSDDLLRRAVLLLDSDATPDPVLFAKAAQHALASYDAALAERLARAAVAAGAGPEASSVLGHALSWQNRPEEAEAVLSPLDTGSASDFERAMVAIPRAANLFWTLGRADDGERVLADALAAVADYECRTELRSMGLCFALFRNRPHAVVTEGAPLVSELAGAGRPLPWGAVSVAMGQAVSGQLNDALGTVRTQLDILERDPNASFHRVTLTHAECVAHRLAGRPAEAERAANRGLPLSLTATWAPHMTAIFRGQAVLERGRPRTAAAWLREAAIGLAGHDPAGWRFVALFSLTQALGMLGRAEETRRAVTEMEAEYRACHGLHEPDLLLARAWAAAADGALSAARDLASGAADVARGAGQAAVEAVALHTGARFGNCSVADRLADLATVVDGRFVTVAAAHAAALAADDGAGLDAASTDFDGLGMRLLAADASALAAEVHRRRRRAADAVASAARAARLAGECEDAATPALRVSARPLPLTEREREIADLAASGLSNRALAERLHVSVRTVEGHIYRACSKVDVPNRAGLIALVRSERG